MNIKTIMLIAFLAPLAYLLFGYTFKMPPIKENSLPEIPPKIVEEKDLVLIEINSIPPPFNLGGDDPYVVWINGCRVHPPKKSIINFVNLVGKENFQPIKVNDIHKGWMQPHYIENVSIKYPKGRTRLANENN